MMTYTERRQQQQRRATTDGQTFRGLLWEVAEQLGAGEHLEVMTGEPWLDYVRASWTPALQPGEQAEALTVRVERGRIGMHTMVDVGLPYTSAGNKKRTGINKATAEGILKDCRIIIARARAAKVAAAQRQDAAAEAKAAAEAATGLPMHRSWEATAAQQTGFSELTAWRDERGALRVTVTINRSFSPEQITRLHAILMEAK